MLKTEMTPEQRTAHNRSTDLDCQALINGDDEILAEKAKSKTEQNHKDQCDLNWIMKDAQRAQFILHSQKHEGKYDDFTFDDFQQAMYITANAQQMFDQLPAMVRRRFGNSPASFLEFVQNPDNKAELEKMGILRGNDGLDINGVPNSAPVSSAEVPSAEITGAPEAPAAGEVTP